MDKTVTPDIICVKTFLNRMEADVAKSRLACEGVPCYVTADDAGGAFPFPFANKPAGVRLMVKQTDRKKAEKILQ